MQIPQFSYLAKYLISQDKYGYSIRIFIALSGAWGLCAYLSRWDLMTVLFLGAIASAMAESEDYWRGRIIALGVTLLCFVFSSFSVTLLFSYKLFFAAALMVSAFVLIMLGSLGARYAMISQATLVLAVYSMLSMDSHQEGTSIWQSPILLLASALWYGIISVIWAACFRYQSVQHNLADVYLELSYYLRLKSSLFEPLRDLDVRKISIKLARQNSKIIAALNNTRDALIQRMGRETGTSKIKRYRKLYFMAQDIHERVSASHYPYNAMAEEFFHSDVLFRAKRLLKLQAKSCKKLGISISMQTAYPHSGAGKNALADLQNSIEFLKNLTNQPKRALRRALQALSSNLAILEQKFIEAADNNAIDSAENTMRKIGPKNLRDIVKLMRKQCTLSSSLFRHAIRKSIALTIGYAVLNITGLEKGYWILLTIVFVCQQGYGTTLNLLGQRISGTVLGLIGSWALFRVFPDPILQSILAIIAGMIFFIKRDEDRRIASACMTLLAFFCFNQIGDSHQLFIPRVIDTVIGCAIAAAAVLVILPDWHGRKLYTWFVDALRCNAVYLDRVINQYQEHAADDLAYRIARRDAHNAEVALSSKISDMLREPKTYQTNTERALRFLTASNALLSYISALGTQRDLAINFDLFAQNASNLVKDINNLADCLEQKTPPQISTTINLDDLDLSEDDMLIFTNLDLISKQLADIKTLINDWLQG